MKARPRKRLTIEIIQLWSGTFMIALTILVFATMPEKQAEGIGSGGYSDLKNFLFWKGGHSLGFALFAGILTLALSATIRQHIPNGQTQAAAFLVAFALGIATETLQIFIPGRVPQVSDLGLDIVGALIGIKLALQWRKIISDIN